MKTMFFLGFDRGCHLCRGSLTNEDLKQTGRNCHGRCVTFIEKAADGVMVKINELSKQIKSGSVSGFRRGAEEHAIDAVAYACSEQALSTAAPPYRENSPSTIVSYGESKGGEALTDLFNTIGVPAVQKYFTEYEKYFSSTDPHGVTFKKANERDLKIDYSLNGASL